MTLQKGESATFDVLKKMLDILGSDGKRAVLVQLEKRYRINGDKPVSVKEVEHALKEMFGSASDLMVEMLEDRLEKVS